MKIVINKAFPKEIQYRAGDIISLGNPYRVDNYLLIQGNEQNTKGWVDLSNGRSESYCTLTEGFAEVVRSILQHNDWDEWTLVKSENVTLTLDCKDGAIEQRNNSGSF